jgi:hypothetical protein
MGGIHAEGGVPRSAAADAQLGFVCDVGVGAGA